MAQSNDGGPRPPQDFLLTDRTAREPEAGTGPDSTVEGTKTDDAERDTPARGGDAPAAGAQHPVGTHPDPGKTHGEPRTGADMKAEVRALEDLSERLKSIEALVDKVPPLRKDAGEIGEQLKLTRSVLVGMSSRMEALERLVHETAGEIRGTGDTVRESAARVEKRGLGLDLAASNLEGKLDQLTRIEDDTWMLKRLAVASIAGNAIVLVLVFAYVAGRLGWIG